MTRIAYWSYELVPRSGGAPRDGALIRVSREEGSFGYADCHPWPEIGEPPLDVQLRRIKVCAAGCVDETIVVLTNACADEWLRKNNLSAFAAVQLPPNHASAPWLLHTNARVFIAELARFAGEGFREVKVKVGADPKVEIERLVEIRPQVTALGLKLRLDFNARLTPRDSKRYLAAIGASPDWIDWVEDPTPFEPRHWKSVRSRFGIRTAIDQTLPVATDRLRGAVDVIVVKPATQEPAKLFNLAEANGYSICVTSSLGHPVGQMTAAAAIPKACNATIESGGILTHGVYCENRFSRLIRSEGPSLVPPEGAGHGFGPELEALDWQELTTWDP